MNGSNLSRQRLLLIFYVVTFGISWCGVAIAVSYGGIPRDAAQMARMIPVLVLAMLAGPALASILFTRIAGGRMAYRDLLSALIRWRVPMGWYTAALLTAPLVLMTVPCALSLRFPNFLPRILTAHNKGQILLMGFIVGSIAAFFEELGWTGFVIPKLRLTLGSFSTAFIVGVLSGAWHLPVNILSCVTQAGISVSSLVGTLTFSLGLLPALEGTHGEGVGPFRQLASRYAHAPDPHGQQHHPWSRRDAWNDGHYLQSRTGRRHVDRCRSDRCGQPQPSFSCMRYMISVSKTRNEHYD